MTRLRIVRPDDDPEKFTPENLERLATAAKLRARQPDSPHRGAQALLDGQAVDLTNRRAS